MILRGTVEFSDFGDKQSYGCADKEGRGSKIPKFLWTYLMEAPAPPELTDKF